jgi:hypothetical protein
MSEADEIGTSSNDFNEASIRINIYLLTVLIFWFVKFTPAYAGYLQRSPFGARQNEQKDS